MNSTKIATVFSRVLGILLLVFIVSSSIESSVTWYEFFGIFIQILGSFVFSSIPFLIAVWLIPKNKYRSHKGFYKISEMSGGIFLLGIILLFIAIFLASIWNSILFPYYCRFF